MTTALAISNEVQHFELMQRKAKMYSTSTLVPKDYQGNISNVMIAMEMAERLGVNDLQCMQQMHIIHGRPAFSSQFLISCFNSCGRFSAIKYRMGKDKQSCVAYATELSTGEVVEGTEVTMEMAKAEGWMSKAGSKWKTMPEHMLRWRAAAFLVRQVAPEVAMGFHTAEEVQDIASPPPIQKPELLKRIEALHETPVEPPKAEEVSDTWDDLIAACETQEAVITVLAEIDDEVSPGPFRDSIVALANERIEQLKPN